MKEIRIIVAGGRDFDNYQLLSDTLTEYIEKLDVMDLNSITFISGTARGADRLGERFANNIGLLVRRFPANWDEYGKSAGYIRNKEMAEYTAEGTGVLFAFWNGESRGTKHMIDLAHKYGLEVHVIMY